LTIGEIGIGLDQLEFVGVRQQADKLHHAGALAAEVRFADEFAGNQMSEAARSTCYQRNFLQAVLLASVKIAEY